MRQMVFNINSQYAKISEVINGVFVSGVCALTPAIIAANNIKMIVNTTEEVPNVKSLGKVEYLKLSLKDTPETDMYQHFFQLCQKIEEMINAGKNVLIHSVQGTSRCATLCLAYIIKSQGKSLKDAYELLKSKRAMVKINAGFWKQLNTFEQEIKHAHEKCNETSTSMASAEHRTSNVSSAEIDTASERKLQNQLIYDSMNVSFNSPETNTMAAFAQVFYREIKRRTKCRRRITPVFQPVLETLYEQTEIAA